ncbi:MAG: threonine synthase, partial [Kitasatospora sp.]|nr:threonine synthase [Kitasatospora sp.]
LARREGVFAELASAAGIAGLLQAREKGQVAAGSRVVCTITGNGLKDPDWAVSAAPTPVIVPADAGATAAALELDRVS